MKKLLSVLFLLSVSLWSLVQAQNCPFHVRITTQDATCYNNAVVRFEMLDDVGHVLDISTIAETTDFSAVRCFYKNAESDTSLNYSDFGIDTLLLSEGSYWVGMEAICHHSGYTRVDTVAQVMLHSTYRTPSASAISPIATTADGYGRRPSLECANTGRIQLKIEDGKFPYKVRVTDAEDNLLKTVVFDGRMYADEDGNPVNTSDLTKYDYMDYYTFDSLAGGMSYHFYVEDGCGYGLPKAIQTVDAVKFPYITGVSMSLEGDRPPYKVKYSVSLSSNYAYYNNTLPSKARYRINYGNGYSSWEPIPAASKSTAVVYDTLDGEQTYCDIAKNGVTFQYEEFACGNTVTKNLSVSKPSPTSFEKDKNDLIDSLYAKDPDNPCNNIYYFRTNYYSIWYETTGSAEFGFFKKPFVWVYTDTDLSQEIKRDTVASLKDKSYLMDSDVIARYGSFKEVPITLHVRRSLVDASGCELFYTDDEMPFKYFTGKETVDWDLDYSEPGDYCGNTTEWIEIYERHRTQRSPDGTIVRLVSSPNGGQFNFEAVYDASTYRWQVTMPRWDNPIQLSTGIEHYTEPGRSLRIYSPTLTAGPYVFNVINGCDTFVLSEKINFNGTRSADIANSEPYSYSYHQECTDRYIKPERGRYVLRYDYTRLDDGVRIVTNDTNSCTFQIVSGPKGGYTDNTIKLGDSLRISMRGQYVMKISYGSSDYCQTKTVYDTIDYNGGVVEFDYAYALLCDSSSHKGDVHVKAMNGTAPYTYILYPASEKTGTPIDTIVGDFADFWDVPFDIEQELSCYVTDACGAYFYINMQPMSKADMQMAWFDGGLSAASACEGSKIRVHALHYSEDFTYTWTSPDGKVQVGYDTVYMIPRNSPSGWYKVNISDTSCHGESIVDSIYLDVVKSPRVEILSSDTAVCPGSVATVRFKPYSPKGNKTNVTFEVTFSNAGGTTKQTKTGKSGTVQELSFTTNSRTLVYVSLINDGTCDYTLPEDTMTIGIRTDHINSCVMSSQNDTVCYNNAADLLAKSTLEAPYILNWYSDYELTTLLRSDTMTDGSWSQMVTPQLTETTAYYFAVAKDGQCPTRNGIVTNTLDMSSGNTILHCGETYGFYDDGGPSGSYSSEKTYHTFSSDNGAPVSIRFNSLDLGNGSKMRIFRGENPLVDSMICELTHGSPIPDILVSYSGKMTVSFLPSEAATGWDAYVEQAPGLCIAQVRPLNKVTFRDAVCQNQKGTYDDPYGAMKWSTSIAKNIKTNIQKAGTYVYEFTHKNKDVNGCDSTTKLVLSVEAPMHNDTAVNITSLMGSYTWHGKTYTETGCYADLHTAVDGCDSVDLLYLTVIRIDTSTNEICRGDSTTVWVTATAPMIKEAPDLIPQRVRIGDILCDDETIVRADSFAATDKVAKGIVFYVDSTGIHGWAVGLAYKASITARSAIKAQIHSLTISDDAAVAKKDFNGYGNTLKMKETAEIAAGNDFATNAPGAYWCYYYDHLTKKVGKEHKGWYIPSYGQSLILYGVRRTVNISYHKVKNTTNNLLTDNYLITSTEATSNSVWTIHPSWNYFTGKSDSRSFYIFYPVHDF